MNRQSDSLSWLLGASRMHAWRMRILSALLFSLMTACGFHLREEATMPFKTIQIIGSSTLINSDLTKQLKAKGIRLVSNSNEAEAILELISEQNVKRILSLNGSGVVREYELYYRVTYRTKAAKDATWSLPLVMESRRDYTFTDAILLSKQGEETGLLDNMHIEVTEGILRRLSALKNTH